MARRLMRYAGKSSWLSALIACAALAGCAQRGSQAPQSSADQPAPAAPSDGGYTVGEASAPTATSLGSEGESYDYEESASGSASGSESSEPAPSPPPQARAEKRAADASTRPGLGTVWGEDRTSHIQNTSFFRAEAERPFALATLFYNDRAGIDAMAHESALSNHGDGGFDVLGGAVSVRLLDDMGRPLPAFEVASRNYVVGEHGQLYTIEVQNHTGSRIEAVATVDGLDVVDGEPGAFGKRGYVIAPFDTLQIDGFRRSMDTVAAFRFGSVRDSYAGRKGKARNVGVIGVAFFHEQGSEAPWSRREIERRHTADPFPERFAAPPR